MTCSRTRSSGRSRCGLGCCCNVVAQHNAMNALAALVAASETVLLHSLCVISAAPSRGADGRRSTRGSETYPPEGARRRKREHLGRDGPGARRPRSTARCPPPSAAGRSASPPSQTGGGRASGSRSCGAWRSRARATSPGRGSVRPGRVPAGAAGWLLRRFARNVIEHPPPVTAEVAGGDAATAATANASDRQRTRFYLRRYFFVPQVLPELPTGGGLRRAAPPAGPADHRCGLRRRCKQQGGRRGGRQCDAGVRSAGGLGDWLLGVAKQWPPEQAAAAGAALGGRDAAAARRRRAAARSEQAVAEGEPEQREARARSV